MNTCIHFGISGVYLVFIQFCGRNVMKTNWATSLCYLFTIWSSFATCLDFQWQEFGFGQSEVFRRDPVFPSVSFGFFEQQRTPERSWRSMCVVTVPSLLFYCKGLSLRFLQFLRLWSKPEFAAETKSPGSAIGSSQRAVVFFSLSSPVGQDGVGNAGHSNGQPLGLFNLPNASYNTV